LFKDFLTVLHSVGALPIEDLSSCWIKGIGDLQ